MFDKMIFNLIFYFLLKIDRNLINHLKNHHQVLNQLNQKKNLMRQLKYQYFHDLIALSYI